MGAGSTSAGMATMSVRDVLVTQLLSLVPSAGNPTGQSLDASDV